MRLAGIMRSLEADFHFTLPHASYRIAYLNNRLCAYCSLQQSLFDHLITHILPYFVICNSRAEFQS
jgi:hypothetical protein